MKLCNPKNAPLLLLLVAALALIVNACSDSRSTNPDLNTKEIINKNKYHKMQVEIWSDVMCPFCYIGKRKFENALAQFAQRDSIEIIWKSFQLNPEMVTDASKNSIVALAESKGISVEESKEMHQYVIKMAASVGLEYHMDKTIAANSFKAHRLTHYAKTQSKQIELEEKLFEAYFTKGKNIDDNNTLAEIAAEVGLNKNEVAKMLLGNDFTDDVKRDIYEAQQVGARGVPFFVFDRKYAVSGAQESAVFLNSLQKSFEEWKKNNPAEKLQVENGKVCTPEKECD